MSPTPFDAETPDISIQGALTESETLSSTHGTAFDLDERAEPGGIRILRDQVERYVQASSWRVVVAAVAIGLVAGHLWSSGGTPAHRVPALSASHSVSPVGAVLPPPVPGVCHNYSREAEGSDIEESAPVACDSAHDAVTVAVVDHPAVVLPFVGLYDPSSQAMVLCQRTAEHYLGIGPGVTFSRYSSSVYEPDTAQLAAGQRWLRCDLVKFPTFLGLMPLRPRLQGSLRRGPDLKDAYCVSPYAVADGLPSANTMEAPELGDWSGQADCFGTHALVAVRRASVRSGAEAAAGCLRESQRFRGLNLIALVPPSNQWTGEVLCVAHIGDYENWLGQGKPLR